MHPDPHPADNRNQVAVNRLLAPPWSGRAAGLLLLITCAAGWGCGPASRLGTLPTSSPPAALGDGWEVGPLTMEQLDPARLQALEQSILAGDFAPPDALLIARGGRLV